MIELHRRQTEPQELSDFNNNYPNAGVEYFDRAEFSSAKKAIKKALNKDQGELCVYCERQLAADSGHVEHIKPRNQNGGRPDLCFTYENLAHSCDNNETCGHKKKNHYLPIEPGPGCNAKLSISSADGMIVPISGLSKSEKHEIRSGVVDRLGLNNDTILVSVRKKSLKNFITVLKAAPDRAAEFLSDKPFRYIFSTLL
jgi:uncharacterized protein (TIGR02646 family)